MSVEQVGCDRCGANPGEPCMTNRGLLPTRPHVARIALAAKAEVASLTPEDADRDERDPHRDGCVHNNVWACDGCLAARANKSATSTSEDPPL